MSAVLSEESLFRIVMYWRIFYGTLRISLAASLLHWLGSPVLDVLQTIMRHELVEDPHDLVFQFASGILGQHPFVVTAFVISYFVFWGLLDIVLSVSMLRNHMWAYPIAIGANSAICYI